MHVFLDERQLQDLHLLLPATPRPRCRSRERHMQKGVIFLKGTFINFFRFDSGSVGTVDAEALIQVVVYRGTFFDAGRDVLMDT